MRIPRYSVFALPNFDTEVPGPSGLAVRSFRSLARLIGSGHHTEIVSQLHPAASKGKPPSGITKCWGDTRGIPGVPMNFHGLSTWRARYWPLLCGMKILIKYVVLPGFPTECWDSKHFNPWLLWILDSSYIHHVLDLAFGLATARNILFKSLSGNNLTVCSGKSPIWPIWGPLSLITHRHIYICVPIT